MNQDEPIGLFDPTATTDEFDALLPRFLLGTLPTIMNCWSDTFLLDDMQGTTKYRKTSDLINTRQTVLKCLIRLIRLVQHTNKVVFWRNHVAYFQFRIFLHGKIVYAKLNRPWLNFDGISLN